MGNSAFNHLMILLAADSGRARAIATSQARSRAFVVIPVNQPFVRVDSVACECCLPHQLSIDALNNGACKCEMKERKQSRIRVCLGK